MKNEKIDQKKANKKLKYESIPNMKSELFFITFPKSDDDKIIVVDGPPKKVIEILNGFDCSIKRNNKCNFVLCKYEMIDLAKELQKHDDRFVLKFDILSKEKDNIHNHSEVQNKKIYNKAILDIDVKDNKIKTDTIFIPSVDLSQKDSKYLSKKKEYKKYKGKEVQIVANNADEVARVAKMIGVLLYAFVDNENEFIANGVFI